MLFSKKFRHSKFILISVALSTLVIALNFRFLLMAGGDQMTYLRPEFLLRLLLSSWDENISYALGGRTYSVGVLVPFFAFFRSFSFMPAVWVECLYFVLVLLGIFWASFYFFNSYLFKNKVVSMFSSLFYLSNIFFFANFINYNIHLSFILLPLCLVFVHSMFEGNLRKSMNIAVLISLVFPSVFVNPPAIVAPILLAVSYFVYLLKSEGLGNVRKLFKNLSFSLILLTLLNLWVLYPFLSSLGAFGGVAGNVSGLFNTQSLQELFRSSGGWSFNKYYLGFEKGRLDGLFVDNALFIFSSYFPVLLSFMAVFFRKRDRKIVFFFSTALIGFFLAKGSLAPFGSLYVSAVKRIPYMSIFREPYTKFTLMYLFSIACLFGYFVLFFGRYLGRKKLAKKFYVALAFLFLINDIPFSVGGFIPTRYEAGPIKSYLVKVPQYLYDYFEEFSKDAFVYRVFSLPDVFGARSYTWESGISSGDAVIKFFSVQPVISNRREDVSFGVNPSISNVYKAFRYNGLSFLNYLRILNVGRIAQENSVDWRWVSGSSEKTPSYMDKMLSNLEDKGYLERANAYGKYDAITIKKVPNRVPEYFPSKVILSDKEKEVYKEALYKELKDRPALVSYKIRDEYLLPRIYIPDKLEYTPNPAISMPYVLTFADPRIPYAYYSSKDSRRSFGSEYIAGERKYRKVKLNGNGWHEGWAWPNVSVDPNNLLEYKAVSIKEWLQVFFTRNYMDKADINLWLAIKAVSEIDKFSLGSDVKDKVVNDKYTAHINEVFRILGEVGEERRDSEYWSMVAKVARYLKRASDLNGDDRIRASYEKFLNWVFNNGYPMCGDFCYEFDVKDGGVYKLVIGDGEMAEISDLDPVWYKKVSVRYLADPSKEVKFTPLGERSGDGLWFAVGNVYMGVGKFLVDLNIPRSENIISPKWYSDSGFDVGADGILSIRTQSFFSDLEHNRGVVFVNKLAGWRRNRQYRVSFDYDTSDPSIKIGIVEDAEDPSSDFHSVFKRVLFTADVRAPYTSGGCKGAFCYHFERSFESSSDASEAYLYILNSTSKGYFSDLRIRNIAVREVINPPALLSREFSKERILGDFPSIAFYKISPTKYKIRVKDASVPYNLVFSEAFNKNWKLFLNPASPNSKVYDNAQKTYLGGRVEEAYSSGKVLDFSIFETLRMKEVASGTHTIVNGYANSWHIRPEYVDGAKDYELVLEFSSQRYFMLSMFISLLTLVLSIARLFPKSFKNYGKP